MPVSPAAALASARAPPISTPPVSAVPAAPGRGALRKLRRLRPAGSRSARSRSAGLRSLLMMVRSFGSLVVGRDFEQVGDGGQGSRAARRWRRRPARALPAETAASGCHWPPDLVASRAACSAAQLRCRRSAIRPGRAGVDQRSQVSRARPGDLGVGVGLRVGRARALVVDAGQVIAQRVLEDLVRAQRQVGRIAGEVVGGQVLPHGGDRCWPAASATGSSWPRSGRATGRTPGGAGR